MCISVDGGDLANSSWHQKHGHLLSGIKRRCKLESRDKGDVKNGGLVFRVITLVAVLELQEKPADEIISDMVEDLFS